MNSFDGTGPHPATQTTIAPQVMCPRCETVHVGSAQPQGWEWVRVQNKSHGHLICPDCLPFVVPAKRARARKGGAA